MDIPAVSETSPSPSARRSTPTSASASRTEVASEYPASTLDVSGENAAHTGLSACEGSNHSEEQPQSAHSSGSSVRSNIPVQTQTGAKKKKLLTTRPRNWWWWWEIGAAFLSATSVFLIIVVLGLVQDKPLASWTHSIQPNSLIAVLTTVGKTAMLLVVSSCIAQLKWTHFEQPKRLSDLQLYDDATRGPWGSFMMLISAIPKDAGEIWAGLLAIITILALAVEPMAQQILNFASQDTLLANSSAAMAKAEAVNSVTFAYNTFEYQTEGQFPGLQSKHAIAWKCPYNDSLGDNHSLPLRSYAGLLNGVIGSGFRPSSSCPAPANKCEWSNFTTLAVCHDVQDVTAASTRSCKLSGLIPPNMTEENSPLYQCNYSFPQWDNLTLENDTRLQSQIPISFKFKAPSFIQFQAISRGDRETTTALAHITFMEVKSNITWYFDYQPPDIRLTYGRLFWCTKSYDNIVMKEDLSPALSPARGESLIYDSTEPIAYKGFGSSLTNLRANSTGRIYKINIMQYMTAAYFSRLNSLKIGLTYSPPQYDYKIWTGAVGGNNPTAFHIDNQGIAYFLAHADPSVVMENLATTLSNQILSADNANVTMVPGRAYFVETYIKVRWPWVLVPLVEVVLACLLLVITIITTLKQPLLKTSEIALLVHGLEGWSKEELLISGKETGEELEHLAHGMLTRLETNRDGERRFTRVDQQVR